MFRDFHISSSMPLKPASMSTITNPAPCHTAAIQTAYIANSLLTSQSNLNHSKPHRCIECSNPKVGFNTHFQTKPVTTNDIA